MLKRLLSGLKWTFSLLFYIYYEFVWETNIFHSYKIKKNYFILFNYLKLNKRKSVKMELIYYLWWRQPRLSPLWTNIKVLFKLHIWTVVKFHWIKLYYTLKRSSFFLYTLQRSIYNKILELLLYVVIFRWWSKLNRKYVE